MKNSLETKEENLSPNDPCLCFTLPCFVFLFIFVSLLVGLLYTEPEALGRDG
jgi:hypothetical protein